MTDIELQNLAKELFYIYELVNPDCDGKNGLSSRTNKVLDFEKYAKQMPSEMIEKYCPNFRKSDMPNFQRIIKNMTANYLSENIKTLAIY